MCSESCSTGKAVYIYANREIIPHKHQKFHQILYKNGYAKELTAECEYHNNNSEIKILNDADIVSEKIIELLVKK